MARPKEIKAVRAHSVRYIKLGRKISGWEDRSLDHGEIHFGYGKAAHELALEGNAKKIKEHLISLGRKPQAAGRDAQEVLDFYRLGADCLWITFARDHLWWTFAEPEVTWLGGPAHDTGERMRKCIGGWRNTDIHGKPLRIDSLSTKLTKVQTYQRTICGVEAEDYLLRRINGVEEPLIAKSGKARDALLDVLVDAIASLHWKDFETLADVVFARSGWHRASAIGGTQKLVDVILEQPTTGELAAVQVKSATSQKVFDGFVDDTDATARFDRLFFICHTPKGELEAPADRSDVHLWVGRDFAKIVLRLGLTDWVMEKIA
jgi:hypothetical protein